MKGKTKKLIGMVRKSESWTSTTLKKLTSSIRRQAVRELRAGEEALEELKRRANGKDPLAKRFINP